MSTEGGNKAVVAALLANTGIALTKFVAFFLTGFSSMLAEAIHSVADSGNQGLLLSAARAQKDATAEHPFGYGRERYIYAFIVSIVLFSVGGLFALYEAWHKYHESTPVTSSRSRTGGWSRSRCCWSRSSSRAFSFRTAITETNKIRGEASFATFVRRAKQPELPVILLEDLAALVGLVFALFGVGLTLITGNGIWNASRHRASSALLLVTVAVVPGESVKSPLAG